MPLVKSTHECQQGISKTGILQSSSCEEQHVLRPFSRESSGAVTETKQTLKYITESQSRSTKGEIESTETINIYASRIKRILRTFYLQNSS